MKNATRTLSLGVVAALIGAGVALASTASAGVNAEQKEQPVLTNAQQKEQPIIEQMAGSRFDANLGK